MKQKSIAFNTLKRIIKKSPDLFFEDSAFKEVLEGTASAISSRLQLNDRVTVSLDFSNTQDVVAYANRSSIYINMNNDLRPTKSSLEEQYLFFQGIFAHELGHILLSDFDKLKEVGESIQKGQFPYAPAEFDEIKSALSNHSDYFGKIFPHVSNILEDKYVNYNMKETFKGTFRMGIDRTYTILYPSEKKYSNGTLFENFIMYVHQYLEAGYCENAKKVFKEFKDPEFIAFLDNIQNLHEPSKRFEATYLIFVWGKEYFLKDLQDVESLKKLLQSLQDALEATKIGSGDGELNNNQSNNSNNGQQNSGELNSKTSSKQRNNSQSNNSNNGQQNSNESKSKNSQEPGSKNGEQKGNSKDGLGNFDNGPVNADDLDRSKDPTIGSSGLEKLKKAFQNGAIINPVSAEEVLKRVTEKKIKTSEGKKIVAESYVGDSPAGVSNRRISIRSVSPCKSVYEKIASENRQITNRLIKGLDEIVDDRVTGVTARNLMQGRRINPASTASSSGKIFKKNIMPNDEPELAVSILIDGSGSMYGTRELMAQKTAVIISEFCKRVYVPFAVATHNYGSDVYIYPQSDFEDETIEKYRLGNSFASGCNRDGAALRWAINGLLARPEERKIMIIISDGYPSAYNGMDEATKDIKACVKQCEKNNILLIAAAIGDDKKNIESLYGNSYLDISDLTLLPKKLLKVIKKYV